MLRTNSACLTAAVLIWLTPATLPAQDAHVGFTMPVTITGQLARTHRAQDYEADAATLRPGFRALAYPIVKLGDHWYVYSALQVNSEPFSYYEMHEDEYEMEHLWLQAFVGYRVNGEKTSLNLKVGKLASAFGSYPLRYDDTANPLIDSPLAYGNPLKIRPDAIPCGRKDLPNMRPYEGYVGVHFYCGGPLTEHNGLPPVDLYGIPGAEADLSLGRFDLRAQLTNSSPANPKKLWDSGQHLQWTAGGGWTPWQGLRLGVSGNRGPFMDDEIAPLLPPGVAAHDYPSTGIGADIQFARGRFSTSSEWLRSSFTFPRVFGPVAMNAVYGEVKMILTPRSYAAFRGSWNFHNRVTDKNGRSPLPFQPNKQAYEIAVGYRPNRWQILKVGYEWNRGGNQFTDLAGTEAPHHENVFGVQFVTSLDAISFALR